MKDTKKSAPKAKKAPAPKKAAPRKAAPKAAKAEKTVKAPKAAKPVKKEALELKDFIIQCLEGDKAHDLVTIDLHGKTTIADYMIIVTGTSSRHAASMAQKLRDKLNSELKIKARLEGLETGDWVIVDAGDVIVHAFREEVRKLYNLEKLWDADFSTVHYTRYQSV